LDAQLCGDAHLSNFGGFASPERRLVFDLNDFDETLPGPFEYDVKRMAASFTIAARNNGFTPAQGRDATLASVRAYREAMGKFGEMGTMELWYAHISEDDLKNSLSQVAAGRKGGATDGKAGADKVAKGKDGKGKHGKDKAGKDNGAAESPEARAARAAEKALKKAHTRDSLQALAKLGEVIDGSYRIVSQPPVVVPIRDMPAGMYGVGGGGGDQTAIDEVLKNQFREYRESLEVDRRHLLEKFDVIDVARKVVGVGSVGTRAFIVLLQGRDAQDPLFLQVKEATRSVLEDHLPRSKFANSGERVVRGQRMMQATSDIFLGWTKGVQADRWFYWRQLRDMKMSATIETMAPFGLNFYAGLCGWTLARAHARSGDAIAMAEYLGAGDEFDQSITDFSERYAEQNEKDFLAFTQAVSAGRIEAVQGV
jgi:uncharacterized protein (DUF2252 family)